MKYLKRILIGWICFFTVVSCFLVVPIYAKERIRVGCVDLEKFLNVHDNGTVSGYCAEYLDEIQKYTDWQYDYVEGTWEECLDWLEKGEIDLLMPAQYSQERAEKFLFSQNKCCQDYVALIALEERDDLFFDDPQSYQHLQIGMIKGNYLNQIFEDYVKENNIDVQRQYYDDLTSLNKALEDKEVDMIVNGSMNDYNHKKYIAKLGSLPAYFMTSKKNMEVLKKLDHALAQIELNNPYYVAKLHEKYYGDITRKSIGFTKHEQQYIQDHPQLTIALENQDYPLEYYNKQSNHYKGVMVDLMNIISQNSGIDFQIIDTQGKSAWNMVKSKEADIILSSTASQSLQKEYNMNFTDSYYTKMSSLVAHKQTQIDVDDHLKIAMLGSEPGLISLTQEKYSQWEIVEYNSVDECLEALNQKKVDGALISTLYVHSYQVFQEYVDLIEVLPRIVETPISLGLNKDTDEILISILNKSIHKISDEEVDSIVIENMLDHLDPISFQSLIQNHPLLVVMVCGIVMGLVVFIVLEIRFNHMIMKKNKLLEEKNKALLNAKKMEETLKEKMRMDSLSGLLNKVNTGELIQAYLDGHQGSLLIVDIDHFKNINDSYGHLSGDQVIKGFGSLLKRHCRSTDIVGRVGGDEFVVFLKDICDKETMTLKAQGIIEESQKIMEHVSCSIGIACYPDDAVSYEELYEKADQALYCAKNLGRSCFCFYSEIDKMQQ